MKIHEYQAKDIFRRYGIPVPAGAVARSPQEARRATVELGGEALLKAQVHAGGRGIAGGVRVVHSPEEAELLAGVLLGRNLSTHQTDARGLPVNQLLVEELANISREVYLAITVDPVYRGLVVLACPTGGVDIEDLAATSPQEIHTEPIDPGMGISSYKSRRLAAWLRLEPSPTRAVVQIVEAMYQLILENDCSMVEINPLIINDQGRVVALDAKINLEDEALFRHPQLVALRDRLQEDELEAQAADLDISYVHLDGDVGCLVNGAGLAMATLDATRIAGASPANFLDVGGGASDQKVATAVSIILSDPKVKKILVNTFGGILRCDLAAQGIVQAYRQKGSTLPLVVRMLGTNVDEGKAVLRDSGLPVVFADTLAEAAQAISQAG
jgi:succinyl-CoA synthetase beta subunit